MLKHIAISAVIVALAGSCTYGVRNIGYEELTQTKIVRDGERVCSSNSQQVTSCEYRVYTSVDVFSNKDDIIHWKFNSSDVHSEMREGRVCDLTVVGWRVRFLSLYKNVIKAECYDADAS